jgi:hypothetical protein
VIIWATARRVTSAPIIIANPNGTPAIKIRSDIQKTNALVLKRSVFTGFKGMGFREQWNVKRKRHKIGHLICKRRKHLPLTARNLLLAGGP